MCCVHCLKQHAANLKFQNICLIHELIEFPTPDPVAQISDIVKMGWAGYKMDKVDLKS
jgi:hypothetical protein